MMLTLDMLMLRTNPDAVHGRFTLLEMTVSRSVLERRGRFVNLIERINDRCSTYEQLISRIYEQISLPIVDTMAEDLTVSCCTKRTTQLPDVRYIKWMSMSEGRDDFAMLEDWLFILIFPSI